MTGKRFIFSCDSDWWTISDNTTNDERLWGQDVVDRLNELHEEKLECENEIARLQLIITKVKDKDYDNYTKKIQELSEENKELKNELNLSKLKFHKMYMGQIEENKELKEKNKFILGQIKAFRDDCATCLDFDGASTLNRLLDILKSSMEIWE